MPQLMGQRKAAWRDRNLGSNGKRRIYQPREQNRQNRTEHWGPWEIPNEFSEGWNNKAGALLVERGHRNRESGGLQLRGFP